MAVGWVAIRGLLLAGKGRKKKMKEREDGDVYIYKGRWDITSLPLKFKTKET